MEVEVETNTNLWADSAFELSYETDANDESEKCGICMDIVVDRGVLDCCQHWFCFGCIDNWASITNLCPLCQNEFQLITCVPVYDTIGSSKVDDDSPSRDDDWFIQRKNNTLSFPSYYIDENAVVCLDGDGCKIRNGATTSEDDSNLDTSIACDSCDKWYHAFCVGFDPESTSESSWLCPRCVIDEEPQNSCGMLTQIPSIEGAITGKLSVSLPDTGETAVVVSLIERKQSVEEASEDVLSILNIDRDNQSMNRKNDTQPNVDPKDASLALCLSQLTGTTLSSDTLPLDDLKTNCADDVISESNGFDEVNTSADLLSNIPNVQSEPPSIRTDVDLCLGLFVDSSLSAAKVRSTETENLISGAPQLHNSSTESSPSEEKMRSNETENHLSGVLQKHNPSKGSSLSADQMNDDIEKHISGVIRMDNPSKESSPPVEKMRSDEPENIVSGVLRMHFPSEESSPSADKLRSGETGNEVSGPREMHNPSTESSPSDIKSIDKVSTHDSENYVSGVLGPQKSSRKPSLSVEETAPDAIEATVRLSGVKRKSTRSSDHVGGTVVIEHENDYTRDKTVVEVPSKKAKADRKSQQPLKHDIRNYFSRDTPKLNCLPGDSHKLNHVLEKEDVTSDIMTIVRGVDHRHSNMLHPNPGDKSSKGRDNGNGLRVKKIMRRAVEDESSKIVEKLRKEIREAVRNKAANDLSKSKFFDPKLLTAFRAAIAGPRAEQEPVKKLNTSVVRTKKSMLQKGKARGNLTKKIYGTTNGRRRRAWDREWEVEFWKYRCKRATQPEKVETLKSVLDLLSRSSERMEHDLECEAANPIMSRLYLADTSLFPRNDDIKPLSALRGTSSNDVNKEKNWIGKVSKPLNDDSSVLAPRQTTKTLSQVSSSSDIVKGGDFFEGESSCTKLHCSTAKKNSTLFPSGSKVDERHLKEIPGKSDVKSDKRKWALEVLARKTAAVGSTTQGNLEDNSLLKGNFPLLAQLPTDMRPVLAASHLNKVPISVRQAQLYHLTEHLLRKADLPVIRRTAESELAVADAINIEKEVADRSNSKLVYLNLCSRVLSQQMNNSRPVSSAEADHSSRFNAESIERATKEVSSDLSAKEALRMAGLVSDSPPNSPMEHLNVVDDSSSGFNATEVASKGLSFDLSAQEALRMAGLVFDSPANSPLRVNLNTEDDSSVRTKEDVPDNVIDMDAHGDMDFYGDFEYDLEEDYISGSVVTLSKSQLEESDLRMKFVFSTINTKVTDNDKDLNDNQKLGIVETPNDSPCFEYHKGTHMGCSTFVAREDASSLPNPLHSKIEQESYSVQCEDLYGLDKEPLLMEKPDKESGEENMSIEREALAESITSFEHINSEPDKARRGELVDDSNAKNIFVRSRFPNDNHSSGPENSASHSLSNANAPRKDKKINKGKQSDTSHSVFKKVEAYIKDHIRPLCKSGVITVEQYRWAVGKASEKIMKYHSKDKNANFLIKEGEKVKKLAQQYVEAAQQKSDGL